jgi:hypothetical protein
VSDSGRRHRTDYGGLALVFAELAGCREIWKQALEGWSVEQSQQVLEWQAEARKQGKAEGITEGEAKGIAEGIAESVLRLLERRFAKPVPPDVAAKIRATTNLGQLDQWFDAAFDVRSLAKFRCLVQP